MRNTTSVKFKNLKDIVCDTSEHDEEETVIHSGFQALDEIIGGFESGKLYLLGGRPSMGKTAFMLDMAINIAVSDSKPIYIFSLEHSEEQLIERLVNRAWDPESGDVESKNLDKIYICDQVMALDEIVETIRDEITDGIVFIDYLQLVIAARDCNLSYKEHPTDVSVLKQLAEEAAVPIVITSQLSRAIEDRKDKRPHIKDIVNTSVVEKADTIIFIYRYLYYDDPMYNTVDDYESAELIVAKNSNGYLGTAVVPCKNESIIDWQRKTAPNR